MTTIADTFDRANESPLGTSSDASFSWTDVTGVSAVTTNKATQSSGTMLSRAQIDLASDDHEVHAEFHTSTNISVLARFASAASTFYLWQAASSTNAQLFKCVTGTFTQLGSDVAITFVAGDVFKLECNTDDTIKGYQNGTLKITASSETSITGNTRTGLRSAGAATWDNFGAADLATAPTYPQLERFGHRGAFRGMLH